MRAGDRRRHGNPDGDRVRSRRRWLRDACGLAVGGLAGVGGCLGRNGSSDETDPLHADYETREVRVETADGDRLGSVTAAVADTPDLRYTGLSDTESLPDDRGMLFVHESVRDRTYVMRRMDFGIDIVYADADGTITEIHHAPAPGPDEDGASQGYPGRGKYVLEVAYRWTAERGVSAGDALRFDPIA